jgi:hypothetical protein
MSWFGISNHLPSYRCLITSYMAGKAAAKK